MSKAVSETQEAFDVMQKAIADLAFKFCSDCWTSDRKDYTFPTMLSVAKRLITDIIDGKVNLTDWVWHGSYYCSLDNGRHNEKIKYAFRFWYIRNQKDHLGPIFDMYAEYWEMTQGNC